MYTAVRVHTSTPCHMQQISCNLEQLVKQMPWEGSFQVAGPDFSFPIRSKTMHDGQVADHKHPTHPCIPNLPLPMEPKRALCVRAARARGPRLQSERLRAWTRQDHQREKVDGSCPENLRHPAQNDSFLKHKKTFEDTVALPWYYLKQKTSVCTGRRRP